MSAPDEKQIQVEKEEMAGVHHDEKMSKTNDLAQQAAIDEHDLGVKEAIRRYPRAIMWSVLVSTAIIMEGYDIVLISSFFGLPSFTKKYGSFVNDASGYQISAPWQAGLSNGTSIGTLIGSLANGFFVFRYGYRLTLLVSLSLIVVFVFIPFFAPSLPVLLLGQILCGIPWGVFATMAPAYASEVCPLALRGYLTVYVNLCWAFGQLIAAGVLSGFSEGTSQWSYRIPFAIQWAWPIPLFAVLYFAPESPYHHVRRGEYEKAENSVRRLGSASHPSQSVALMIHTNELEKEIDAGTSYLDCFRGIDLRRTEIVCMAFIAQPFCGSAMGGTPTYFFLQAGLPTSISFKMSVGGLGLAAVGTLISWKLLHVFGRRTLYLAGLAGLTAILWIVGFISVGAGNSTGGYYAQATMMLLWLFVYYMTVGPICYAIIGEISSTRLRNKSISLSRSSYYIGQIICNVVNPYMLNPSEGDWKGKTGFFWGGCSFVFFVWTWFRLPESKDRSFEELDLLFAQNVKARDFSKAVVDPYAEDLNARVTFPGK
ncbi:general substrate transporter [Rhexocercosporidium sp. MPI-PUGE-AT-0058]|nr:general substrate transporter [Rhexocercosporidium sp. MPI-PUGE-AT-0058]